MNNVELDIYILSRYVMSRQELQEWSKTKLHNAAVKSRCPVRYVVVLSAGGAAHYQGAPGPWLPHCQAMHRVCQLPWQVVIAVKVAQLSSAQVRDNIEMHFWNNEVACSGAELRTRAGNKPSRSLCFTITEKPLTHGNHKELVCLASASQFHFYLTCFNAQLA